MTRPRSAPTHRIDPFDLHLFAAVCEAGSITAGATRVHLSLAAASERLQALEHTLGAALLLRSRRGVSLTDAGRTLLQHAGLLQRQLEALHADLATHAQGVRSTVRLACNTAAMTELLPPLLGEFLAAHADVDVDLRELDSLDTLAALRRAQADIGILADHVDTQGLRTQALCEDRLVALLPAQPARASRAPVSFAALLERPFVGLPADSGLSRFLAQQALRLGRGLRHRVRVRSVEAVATLVAQGVGVAILPAAAAQRLQAADARLRLQPISDAWSRRRLMLCMPEAGTPHAAAHALADFLLARVAPAQ